MVNRDRLLDLFLQLIKTNSPSKSERGVADLLKPILQELGYSVKEDETGKAIGGNTGNVMAYKEGSSPNGYRLLLSAHMDTVEPTPGLQPIITEDGVIKSDGTTIIGADDKAGIAEIIEALRVIEEDGIPYRSIQLLFDVSEEVDLLGARNVKKEQLNADFGYIFDTEKPTASVVVSAPSHVNFKFRIKGIAAHAGIHPEKGVNAIVVASKAISAMKLGRLDFETTANIGVIKGGKARNIVAEECEVTAEARSRNPEKLAAQVEHMEKCFKDAAAQMGAELEIDKIQEYDTYRWTEEDDIVRLAVEAGKKIDIVPEILDGGGGSDANILNAIGLPSVVIGVGYEGAHSKIENIAIDDMVLGAKFAVALVEASTEK
jgi:tripeptide aminopeptidase